MEEEALLKLMVHRTLSRRRFIENSLSSGLAAGLGLGGKPLSAVAATIPEAEGLSLKVTGDAAQGFGVTLLFNGQPTVRHNQGGEFSDVFQNEDRNVDDRVANWQAASRAA